MKYNAGNFSDYAELSLGKDLWKFLNREDNIIRMETATDLGRTAAEAISKKLLEEFGADVKVNRVKQMIGHMIRQIMENRGYQIGSQNVKVNDKRLFVKATKYQDGTTTTTQIGYINRKNQKNHGHMNLQGNDHGALAYKLECLLCGHIYGANGTDIFQRKCPACQNGKPGIPFEEN
ncbi:MAG: hypothetical protein ABFS18_14045 [Thermodesulfobacteriota bacterium]